MELYSENESYKLYKGNMLDVLEVLKPNSIDSIVTDPPYGLTSITQRFGKEGSAPAQFGKDGAFSRLSKGFMGKEWDGSGIEYNVNAWSKLYNVLKPGGYMLVFGGSRTFYRIACAIEDAGFEIRDTIMWLYGSGFPKGLNLGKGVETKLETGSSCTQNQRKLSMGSKYQPTGQVNSKNGLMFKSLEDDEYLKNDNYIELTHEESKMWDGWNTSLKPAFEPIIMAKKPTDGNIVDNVLAYGVGGINIDECRVGDDTFSGGTVPEFRDVGPKQMENGGINKLSFGQVSNANRVPCTEEHIGRFPSNVILSYDEETYDEVCSGFPYTKSNGGSGEASKKNTFKNTYNGGWGKEKNCSHLGGLGDEGSASRYFYCAKASKKDRDEGLDGFEEKQKYNCDNSWNSLEIFGTTDGGRGPVKNIHPTVKPTTLMQYLIRLVTPNGGTILDPFNGSGSTGKAAMYENKERNKDYKYIGIELDEEYLSIAKARIEYAITNEICDISGINPNGISNKKVITKNQRKLF